MGYIQAAQLCIPENGNIQNKDSIKHMAYDLHVKQQ
jgi:hypothetical protein